MNARSSLLLSSSSSVGGVEVVGGEFVVVRGVVGEPVSELSFAGVQRLLLQLAGWVGHGCYPSLPSDDGLAGRPT